MDCPAAARRPECVSARAARTSRRLEFCRLLGGSNSDFATFRDEGITGVEFAYLRGSPIYHTMADTPDRVSLRSLQQQGANALAPIRHIGNLGLDGSPHGSNAVFFNVGRFSVVRYPIAWALPIALLAGVMLLAAGWRQGGWRQILRSAAVTIAMGLGSAAVAVGVWTVLVGQRGTLGVAESYLYLAGLLGLTGGIGSAVPRLTGRQISANSDAAGVVAVWWALGLLTAIVAPGMSYLFVWPALAGGLTLLRRSSLAADRRWQLMFSVPVIGATLVLLVPAVDIFYQLAQPRPGNPDSEILSLIAIAIVLLALAVELLRVFWVRKT